MAIYLVECNKCGNKFLLQIDIKNNIINPSKCENCNKPILIKPLKEK